MTRKVMRIAFLAGVFAAGSISIAVAAPNDTPGPVGPVTRKPVPRYASLKSDRVNLREGPSKDHRTAWIFQRAGLPVEITAESDTWRRVRDSEGSEGWVQQALISDRRTSIVSPAKKGETLPLYAKPDVNTAVVARIQPGVIGHVKSCDPGWCRIFGDGFDGYMQQSNLWGVYPGEKL